MNIWIFISGLIALLTSFIHIFAGQIEPVRPFLKSRLDGISKATLLACWHITSVTLLTSSCLLTYVGWVDEVKLYDVVFFLGVLYCLYGIVFIVIGIYFFSASTLIKLPQWSLLLPIGLLAIWGGTQV
ncbi:hypothetical protein [Alteromonas confluentis]|uniref:DUF423 domain-containing protein n=1 Tax=Alteromonas confluentis TaxID=1656094 RepID=A0A1E7Z9E9_9ALTE|nr:hypothetical protein [Alteromonas confluentis]OFC70034.1 hypothetical protein BFC18_15770 [Alteromonas confluentis]